MKSLFRRYMGSKAPKGSTIWMVMTGVSMFVRLLRWMARRDVETLMRESIEPGQSMTIQLLDVASSKSTRKALKLK